MKRPTKKQAQKWANALRSGEYKQGKNALQSSDGYCCLGLACDIFIPKSKHVLHEGILSGIVPTGQHNAPKWLKDVNDDVYNKIGHQLSALNDSGGYSFDELADIIELIYVHKAI